MRAVPHIPPPGFWRRVRAACDRHGTLLIFDEIPTGLGKTDDVACEHDESCRTFMVLARPRRRHPADRGGLTRPELDVGAG